MNEMGKIIVAGLLGAVATLLVMRGLESAVPRPVVHYWAPEPADLSAEDKAKMQEVEAQQKAARLARQQALTQRCVEARGSILLAAPEGLIACMMPAGTMPPAEWLEGKP